MVLNERSKFLIYSGCLLFAFIVLTLRFAYVQLIEGDTYRDESDRNRVREIVVNAIRHGNQLDLDKVVRIVKMIGYVNAAPGFQEAPWVLNGASDLLVQVFGPEKGKHARAALYQNELTYEAPIEIEMTVQVEP